MRVLVGGLAKRIIEREQVLQGERQKGQKKKKKRKKASEKSREYGWTPSYCHQPL